MRTVMLDELTWYEVKKYLERNDIAIDPIGVIELHGEWSLGMKYFAPPAIAKTIAEEVDGIVIPHTPEEAEKLDLKRKDLLGCSSYGGPKTLMKNLKEYMERFLRGANLLREESESEKSGGKKFSVIRVGSVYEI
ncbi:MAG: creatininase family protein [Candidatus Bathyarchaeia archaeon]